MPGRWRSSGTHARRRSISQAQGLVRGAVTAFGDPLGQIIDDPRHRDEERFVAARAIRPRRLLV